MMGRHKDKIRKVPRHAGSRLPAAPLAKGAGKRGKGGRARRKEAK